MLLAFSVQGPGIIILMQWCGAVPYMKNSPSQKVSEDPKMNETWLMASVSLLVQREDSMSAIHKNVTSQHVNYLVSGLCWLFSISPLWYLTLVWIHGRH